jgi:predicted AlkP superfamily pyrophosphatase or phosphodiesterase
MSRAWRAAVLALAVSACAVSSGTAPATAPQVAADTPLRASGGVNAPSQRNKPYLILISIDGFKAEYLDRFELPSLRGLAERGARARAMIPVFPSLTFPNHYSLVTGLHPQRHGIVSNRFYDPARKASYVYTDGPTVTDGSWYGGEPIWVTAESQGMVAACYFWPGSEAEIKGVRPTTYNKYSSGVSNETRVQTVLEWLQLPAERRPHVITLYFSEVDEASHSGPLESPEVLKAAQSVDAAIGTLVAGIDGLPVRDQVYLVITSDHGMVNGSDAQTVRLETILDAPQLRDIAVSFGGPVANLHITGGPARAREIRDTINRRLARGTAYLRQEVPERLQLRENPRAGDIVVVMDEAWAMRTPRPAAPTPARATDETAEQTASGERPARERWGMHGWDNAFPSMRAFFLVSGPGIRRGAIVDEVRTVDVYPLMAELLQLQPASGIDGETGRIRKLIK